MRQLLWWFPLVVFGDGCSSNNLPLTPTTPVASTPAITSSPPRPNRDAGNWTPWLFTSWQPGVGPPLGLNVTINAAVEPNELCVSDIYQQWGARACTRFVVSVPSDGWLHGFLHWDASAQGFDLNLIGEVVLVQRSGRFATSEWHDVDTHVFAKVEPDTYDLLVLSYSNEVRLPFQLRTELRAE
jgi:hypothetical protein